MSHTAFIYPLFVSFASSCASWLKNRGFQPVERIGERHSSTSCICDREALHVTRQ